MATTVRPSAPLRSSPSSEVQKVLDLIKAKNIQVVDVKFCDLPGTWQHFSIPAATLTEPLLCHELVHVRQWREDALFPLRYTLATLRQRPLPARRAQTSSSTWGPNVCSTDPIGPFAILRRSWGSWISKGFPTPIES